jgi:hypothetical protein
MYTPRFFRDINSDSGGDKLPPSLADFDKPPVPTPTPAPKPAEAAAGEPAKTPEEIAEARLTELKAKPADQLTAEEKTELEKLDPPADDDAADKDDDADEDPAAFWQEVDKLSGIPVKIDWSKYKDDNGDPILPDSPQGAFIRDQELRQQTVDAFEAELKATDPRGYAYLLHRQSGGSDDEFFAKKTPNLPAYEVFKTSTDLQKTLYKQSLLDKGLDEEIVTAQVDKAIRDGKIFEKSDAIYKEVQTTHENELLAIEAANQKAQKEYSDSANKLSAALTTQIRENKGLNLVIPEADKTPFTQFVIDTIQYRSEDKKFLVALDLGEEKDRVLEAMYLLYKKGDLSSLIKKEVQKDKVRRLGKAVEKSKSNKTAGADDLDKGKAKIVPFGQI